MEELNPIDELKVNEPETEKESYRFTLTSEETSKNYNGCKIVLNGIDTNQFLRNPVALFNHNSDFVIGKWKNLSNDGKTMEATLIWDEVDDETMKIKSKVDGGFINGCSVGLKVNEYAIDEECDCLIINKSELLECSITPLPADKNALKLYVNDEELTKEKVDYLYNSLKTKDLEPELPSIDYETHYTSLIDRALKVMNLSIGNEMVINENTILLKMGELIKENNEYKEKFINIEEQKKVKYIEDAVKVGKITLKQKEKYLKLAKQDWESVKELIDSMSNQVMLKDIIENNITKSNEDRSDWSFLQWADKDMAGLNRMKENDPIRYNELFLKAPMKK